MADSFGEILTKSRLERGDSLEQVSLVLHIRPRYLEALENEDYGVLPSDVQGKGFLRLYAGYLGLPVQPLLDSWGRKSGISHASPPPVSLEPLKPEISQLEPILETQEEQTEEDSGLESPEYAHEVVEPSTEPEKKAPLRKSADLLVEIGQQLVRQRQGLNLSLADVERHTHVRQRYLEALEAGRMDELPSPVQGRGMLHNYASFLELNADDLLSTFAEALQARRIEIKAPPLASHSKKNTITRKPATKPGAIRRLLTPDLLIGSGLIVVLFIFAVWSATKINALQGEQAVATPPSIAEILLQTSSLAVEGSSTPTNLPNLGTRFPGENGAATSAVDTATPAPTITLPPGGTGLLQVAIVARMSTYMRVTVDGKVVFDGRAIANNAYPFGGDKRIELLIGNAAALQVFFNQTDLGDLGLVGQVKSLILTKSGVVTPTPQFTITASPAPTRTNTLLPSQTLPVPTITPLIP